MENLWQTRRVKKKKKTNSVALKIIMSVRIMD